jgi:hypothetical protein
MPRTSFTFMLVPPAEVVAETYEHVAERFVVARPGFAKAVDILEDAHERFFNRLRGRYVRTGATRASLIGGAPGSIRALHNDGLRFGTDVPHAHFLTKAPKDPEAGQISKGNSGEGRSAVVIFPRSAKRAVAKELLDWIVEPAE